eukprot:COSAG06_NODE_3680_length_5023_cov_11.389115_5_plen_82_part_00
MEKVEGKRGDHSAGLTIVTSGAVMIGIGGLSQGYEMSNQVRPTKKRHNSLRNAINCQDRLGTNATQTAEREVIALRFFSSS